MEIINIGKRIVNQYLIKINNEYLLIDTGYPNGFKRFESRLRRVHIALNEIKYVFITHAHDDHVGFLGELLTALPNIKLIINPESTERLQEGHNRFIGGATTLRAYIVCKLMSLFGKGKHKFPILDADKYLTIWNVKNDFLRPYGIHADIITLQGHTSDSIGLLFDNGLLFCGDATMNGFPSKKKVIIFVEDLETYKETWDKIIANNKIAIVYPSHGKPFEAKKIKDNRNILDKIKLRKI